MMIMTELMPGSLRSLLANVQVPFETPAVVKVALGISRAMSFLHSMTPPVLHRDLKSTHVLVRGGCVVVFCALVFRLLVCSSVGIQCDVFLCIFLC
jgi:serine/threonine protein kinase